VRHTRHPQTLRLLPSKSASRFAPAMSAKPAAQRHRPEATFDRFAGTYEELHAASIKASGEPTAYFAEYKMECLVRLAAKEPILDFGCGVGNLTQQLVKNFGRVHAYDPSTASLDIARGRAEGATFHQTLDDVPDGSMETVVLSGVLHHVEPADRARLLQDVSSKLTPRGRIVVFEHNPLNPLTRRVVAGCPFDEGARLLFPWQLRRAMRQAGFVGIELRYIVFFPRFLAALRPLEPKLSHFCLGAQTMCIGAKAPLGR
jgi:SAM-dependent methyltransferase